MPPGGVLVEALDPECCAAHAGLVVGDVIYRVNGEDLVGPRAFLNMLLGSSDDSEVVLHVHGKTVRECFDKTEGKIGLTCECHSEALVNREGGRHVHSNHGVVISGLRAESMCRERGICVGHILLSVNGECVATHEGMCARTSTRTKRLCILYSCVSHTHC